MAAACVLQGCGVFSRASDCAERAACPDTAVSDGGADADANANANADADADAAPEAGEAGPDAPPCIPVGPEDCSNGIDDDCNGAIDCADLACSTAGFACAPAVPSGWVGPVALAETPASSPAPTDCPAGYDNPITAQGGLSGPDATCGCTCAFGGARCQPVTGQFFSDTSCTTACTGDGGTVTIGSDAGCVNTTPCQGVTISFNAPAPQWTATCSPSATKTVADAGFALAARVCTWSPTTTPDIPGGCNGSGDQCLKSPAAPFGTRLCIYQAGDPPATACPTGPYSNYHVYYAGIHDTRDCSACTCDPASGGTCPGSIGFHGDNTCGGTAAPVYTLGTSTCVMLTQPVHASGSFAPSGGACGAGVGGQPMGMVSGVQATVVCCH